MYRPSHFAEDRPEVLAALLRRHPLGLLLTQDVSGRLDVAPIPFLLDPDPGGGPGILRGHVARANPVWHEARADRPSLVVFQGPEAYVSPARYPSKREHGKVVPTWNYVVVEARGRLAWFDDPARLRALVGRLTDRHEAARPRPWSVDDAPAGFTAAMLGAIVGIEIVLEALAGKWKASQNRSAADREGVAAGLSSGLSSGLPVDGSAAPRNGAMHAERTAGATEAGAIGTRSTGASAMAAIVRGEGDLGSLPPRP